MSNVKNLTGTFGEVWIDGDKVGILKKVNVKVIANREDVQIGLDVESNLVGLKGEFNITLGKVYTRWSKHLDDIRAGVDKRIEIITKLKDPNARGGGIERYSVGDCWLNEIPIANYEVGTPIDEEISGGFPPSKLINLDRIA